MTAAESNAQRVDAVNAQQARIHTDPPDAERWRGLAAQFRMNPRRTLDANRAIPAEYVEPGDVVLDVGGGAGRLSLPLALRCREVLNIDPSAAMIAQFEASAAEAEITNARAIQASWPPSEPVEGDVCIVASVTYFVREIVPFLDALRHAARRRVMITVWDSPPMLNQAVFPIVHGEEQERVPSYRELLPALWEMGVLPDVRVLPVPFSWPEELPRSREEAVNFVATRMSVARSDAARERIAANLDQLFDVKDDMWTPRWRPLMREMLITWET